MRKRNEQVSPRGKIWQPTNKPTLAALALSTSNFALSSCLIWSATDPFAASAGIATTAGFGELVSATAEAASCDIGTCAVSAPLDEGNCNQPMLPPRALSIAAAIKTAAPLALEPSAERQSTLQTVGELVPSVAELTMSSTPW